MDDAMYPPIFNILIFFGLLSCRSHAASVLTNNSFDVFSITSGNYNSAYNSVTNPEGYVQSFADSGKFARLYLDTAMAIGWQTTAADHKIEIWASGFQGKISADGIQFAEINATTAATLYQDVQITAAGGVDYSFYHRGRNGSDTVNLTITYLGVDNVFGGGDDIQQLSPDYTTGNTAWTQYAANDAFTSVANGYYRFAFTAVDTSDHNTLEGNFLDYITFGVNAIPEPSVVLLSWCGMLALLRRRRA